MEKLLLDNVVYNKHFRFKLFRAFFNGFVYSFIHYLTRLNYEAKIYSDLSRYKY